jgi:predicted alpha/beta hydrolase
VELRDTAKAADGFELAVTRFPAEGEAWGTLLVATAMGVRQDFYEPFARHCAMQGLHVLTFDWRGMGASAPESLRGFEADIVTWAERDLDAMLKQARAMAPGLPAFALGHSLGGQLFGAAAESAKLAGIVTVTAGVGWYRLNDRMPLRVRLFWFVALPLLTALFGYFPGKRLRMVGDLPAGVARQWRRWSIRPEYVLAEGAAMRARYDAIRVPILGWSFEDDSIITKPAVDDLHGFYRNAPVERRHVAPKDIGRARIGHFGFFLPASRDDLWAGTIAWLRAGAAG